MSFPWEVSNASAQLGHAIRGYRAAMTRAEKWNGGSLTRRRQVLRRLADECGKRAELELLLAAMKRQHEESPGDPTSTLYGRDFAP